MPSGQYNQFSNVTPEERFMNAISMEPMTGCWLWTGSTANGYGKLKINGKNRETHRWVWEFYVGPIPNDLYVLHKCDTPLCANPYHLFLGTQEDNIRDAVKKRRMARGLKSGRAKFSQEKILEIRNDIRPVRVISEQYGVSITHISNIRTNKRRVYDSTF